MTQEPPPSAHLSAPPSVNPYAAPAAGSDPRFALGQAIGFSAFVWGYPLIESVRTCHLQTTPSLAQKAAWGAPIDHVHHMTRAATAADRDIVTPANDLLYTTGWINLANGPRLLRVPSARLHAGRYFVLALYDAWTNNFANPGLRVSPEAGETVVLIGPETPVDDDLRSLGRVVQSPTNLVWLIGRVVVGDATADILAARTLQADIRLDCLPGTDSATQPRAVGEWVGEAEDTIAALSARPGDSLTIAARFFTNLCHAMAENPAPAADAGLIAWFASAKLVPGFAFDWQFIDKPLQDGLHQGLLDAAALVVANSRSRVARPWAASYVLGRYGSNYLTRALTAYKGLGGLASDEAIYAMGDFDAHKQPLDGQHRYTMRFVAGDLPPVDSFWSVTMYAADRFLYPNPLERFAIGDRTSGLQHDPDGSLTLIISHQRPSDTSNWLPAPLGSFYVMLRMYCPRAEARTWRIPPLVKSGHDATI